jgi:hypothetical protein
LIGIEMEDNTETVDVSDTEITPEREQAELSIRQSLKQNLKNDNPEPDATETVDEDSQESPAVSEPVQQQQPTAYAPPADMNAAEKEAFLNPTPANAHVLQSYLNRRAYETRSDYSRKMQEVEQLKKQTAGLYDTIKQYEDEYARDGISIADVARRSIAWDKAMLENPVATAIDWLDSYGIRPEDLYNYQPQQQQAPEYLTREEAEKIAEERYQSIQSEQQKKAIEYYNQQVVSSFMNNKPLFRDPETASQLEAEMAPVVQALNATGRYSSPEQVLETAYNYVVNGNPTFSGLAQKMVAKPVIEQQQAAVQKAKQAAKSISGSAGSGSPRIVAKNLRDNLQRRMGGE